MSAATTLDLSAADTAAAIASGSASATDVADAALARVQANARLNAFVTVAETADARTAATTAPKGVLHGVPVAVKEHCYHHTQHQLRLTDSRRLDQPVRSDRRYEAA